MPAPPSNPRSRAFVRRCLEVLLSILIGLAAFAADVVVARPAGATTQQTVITTQGETPYVIPSGTVSLEITAVGAAGDTAQLGGETPGLPGEGALIQATITPPSGISTLYAEVGGTNGVGGGGTSDYGTDGGGETDVQTCSASSAGCTYTANPATDPRLIVAGGGGGGGEDSFVSGSGGAGGSAGSTSSVTGPGAGGAGTDSGDGYPGADAGLGDNATPAAVGAGSPSCGSGGDGTVGSPGQGGNGGPCDAGDDSSGSGGGGGWVGGSGGGAGDFGENGGSGGGGGAGSSYVESSATSVTVTTAGSTSPEVIIVATIDPAPAITSAASTTFTTGAAGSFTVTTNGDPTPSISDGSATLPTGVTFTDNGDGTATLAGTPASSSGGTYSFTITASNGVSPEAQQTFTLTVDQPPSITSNDDAVFGAGTESSFSVTTAGYPDPSISDGSAALPAGVTFTDNGNGTATLAGVPSDGTGGSYPFTISAANGVSTSDQQSFTLTVDEAPSITSSDATTFTTGTSGSFTVTTSGFPGGAGVSSISDGGAVLPGGVTFTDNGNGTATISGTPAAGSGGTYPLPLTASNGVSPDAQQTFTLNVDQPPAITSADSTTFTTGLQDSFTVTTTGFPDDGGMTVSDGGATLPSGVTFTHNGNGSGSFSGVPANGTGGVYTVALTASNGISPDAHQTFTLTVHQAPAITSAASTTFTAGIAGTYSVTTTGFPGGPGLTISDGGAKLPSGVIFTDKGNGTATLAGTPALGTGGSYAFTITASNGVDAAAQLRFTLLVDEGPSITSVGATTFTVGMYGSFKVTTAGFPSGPRLTIADPGATLPAGVTFKNNGNGTATLSGDPSGGTAGTYHFAIVASNGIGPEAHRAFTLTVDDGPGYVLAGSDGGVFAFGGMAFHGSMGGRRLNDPVVGIAATPSGGGYWLVATDGGVFAFGNAGFYGSMGGRRLNDPVVGIAATPNGKGYFLVASDGGLFAFGDAGFHGSTGAMRLDAPVVGMTVDALTGGYWLVASDGGVFSFDAPYLGRPVGKDRVVGIAASTTGGGYRIVAADGIVYGYGESSGSDALLGRVLSAPVVGMASP